MKQLGFTMLFDVLWCALLLAGFHVTIVAGYLEIGNLPNTWTVSVHESETDLPRFLYSVRVYNIPDVTVSCSFDPVNSDFSISNAAVTEQWEIKLVNTANLGPSTTLNLVIKCVDTPASANSPTSATLTIAVSNNVKPTFTNPSPEIDISAQTTRVNQVIYTFQYTDPEGSSPLIYVIDPALPTVFSIIDDSLVLSTDLSKNKTSSYAINITARDEVLEIMFPVKINVNDINYIPTFLLTNDTKSFPEQTKGRRLLYTIGYSDGNGDDVQITYKTPNTNNDGYFDLIPSTGEVYLLDDMEFNYEEIPIYTLEVKIADWLEDQTSSFFTLVIKVTDIPESPMWSGVRVTLIIDEGPNGTSVGFVSTSCTDPDNIPPDNITYAILFSPESAYFAIDEYSRKVTFAEDFDYDDTNLANELNLTIRCSDVNGFSADTYLQIIVNDVNDNEPVCAPKPKSLSLLYDQVADTTLSILDCSDKDSTVNAELYYEIIGLATGYSKTYFQVDSGGNVSISKMFEMDFNTSFYVTIRVKDRGTPSLSTTATLTITYTEKPLNITYTKVDDCFICTTSAITVLAALGLFALSVTICLIVLFILKCAYDIERRKMAKAFAKKEKRSWRWFGCWRPGEDKPKKTKEDIKKEKVKDEEYIRARNHLLGISEEDAFGEMETVLSDVPSQRYKRKRKAPFQPTSATNTTYVGRERDKTPDIGLKSMQQPLTESQMAQLKKFQDMKDTTTTDKGPTAQAASGMTWTFMGRKK